MNADCKQRARKLGKDALSVILIGAAYYVFITLTGWAIPCPFRLLTGKYCPGCGVTRMAVALLHLDFRTAFHCNMLTMLLLPILLIWGIYKGYAYIRGIQRQSSKLETAAVLVIALATIVFAVLRNTETFAFLRP